MGGQWAERCRGGRRCARRCDERVKRRRELRVEQAEEGVVCGTRLQAFFSKTADAVKRPIGRARGGSAGAGARVQRKGKSGGEGCASCIIPDTCNLEQRAPSAPPAP